LIARCNAREKRQRLCSVIMSLSEFDFLQISDRPAARHRRRRSHTGRTGTWHPIFEASNNRIPAKRKRNFALHACGPVFSLAVKRVEVPGFGRE
jgi:hypothetical protein